MDVLVEVSSSHASCLRVRDMPWSVVILTADSKLVAWNVHENETPSWVEARG